MTFKSSSDFSYDIRVEFISKRLYRASSFGLLQSNNALYICQNINW